MFWQTKISPNMGNWPKFGAIFWRWNIDPNLDTSSVWRKKKILILLLSENIFSFYGIIILFLEHEQKFCLIQDPETSWKQTNFGLKTNIPHPASYMTTQPSPGGGLRILNQVGGGADLPPTCIWLSEGIFIIFFKLGSCLGWKGPESKSTALYL